MMSSQGRGSDKGGRKNNGNGWNGSLVCLPFALFVCFVVLLIAVTDARETIPSMSISM